MRQSSSTLRYMSVSDLKVTRQLSVPQLREAFRMLQSEYKAVTEEAKAEVIGASPYGGLCTPRLTSLARTLLQGLH